MATDFDLRVLLGKGGWRLRGHREKKLGYLWKFWATRVISSFKEYIGLVYTISMLPVTVPLPLMHITKVLFWVPNLTSGHTHT